MEVSFAAEQDHQDEQEGDEQVVHSATPLHVFVNGVFFVFAMFVLTLFWKGSEALPKEEARNRLRSKAAPGGQLRMKAL